MSKSVKKVAILGGVRTPFVKSLGSYKITYDNFIDIIENLNITNSDMAIKYNINKSSISRIRSGEIYQEFHKIYNRVQRPVSLFV